jgi:hypothetical protein
MSEIGLRQPLLHLLCGKNMDLKISLSSGTIVEEDENEEMMSGDSMAGSKKSVRFNEVVLRQVYRSNSSILGQKHKNQKKAEQKRRKAGRRASEGDKPDSDSKNSFSPDETEDCYQDQVNILMKIQQKKYNLKKKRRF